MTAVLPLPRAAEHAERVATPRRYLMCPPEHFSVDYAINPWMDVARGTDRALAMRQWETLRRTYLELGHEVQLIDAEPGLPDMVFAANGGLVIEGQGLGARFTHAERRAEGPAYLRWLEAAGLKEVTEPVHVNEGEGDFLVVGDLVLAGTGFRTDPGAHGEVQELFGIPVVSLQLVDPRFYHLDTALAVLGDHDVAYYPQAFQPGQPGRPAAAVPRRDPRRRGGRDGAGPQRRLRRPARRAARRRPGPRRSTARAGLRAGRRGSERAAQGRRQRQVLHAGDPQLIAAGQATW